MEPENRIQHAIVNTEVIRAPRQNLSTFGVTNVSYYLVTELAEAVNVVREGRVIAERPRIVTAAYLTHLQGFSENARKFLNIMAEKFPHEAGLFYSYRNEPKEMNVISSPLLQVVENINSRIDTMRDPLSAIIKGVEDLWDVSLMKFTYELTRRSLHSNIADLEKGGMLGVDHGGVPRDAYRHIEELFEKVEADPSLASLLVAELQRWGLFEQYQDRFLALFRGK